MRSAASLPEVVALQRFPVKSMGGQPLDEAAVTLSGLVGDREWAVYDQHGKIASGKHTRRFRRMDPVFALTVRCDGAALHVRLPDGRELLADDPSTGDALSDHFGEPVSLRREADVPHQDAAALSIVGTATLMDIGRHEGDGRPVDPRHLRGNILLATEIPYAEESWVGRELTVGSSVVRVTGTTQRCRMVGVAQVGLTGRPGLLRTISHRHDLMAGVYATVVRPGRVRVGDRVAEVAHLG
ncbi:MOSC domain-containing protein [Pedococcus sp.]|uniref:MOSC domain-containing protein n=1 Tax=Pedococcus sp. TaxID=2860345 RepID=UPI002E0D90F8|nr:MOSC N-terminal beta barrel domain-containing protein [Pedococcus sp.]